MCSSRDRKQRPVEQHGLSELFNVSVQFGTKACSSFKLLVTTEDSLYQPESWKGGGVDGEVGHSVRKYTSPGNIHGNYFG